MEKKIANIELEQLEERNAKLPNGETADLYSIKEGVLLFGISIEGDEYVRGPYFYSGSDAVLHALNPMFLRDTMGFATPEFPANSPSSTILRFNSMLRVRQYRLDSRAFFYDMRSKIRPPCADVGVSNFKIDFDLRIPMGIPINPTPDQIDVNGEVSIAGQSSDAILSTIASNTSEIQSMKISCFLFCSPGKTVRIESSYRLDMSILWKFLADSLSGGYTPNRMRSEIFLDKDRSRRLLAPGPAGGTTLLQAKQVPSPFKELPEKITKSISNGASLRELLMQCSATVLGQQVCVSGSFFFELWNRDVNSVSDFYGNNPANRTYDTSDKRFFFPKTLPTVGSGKGSRVNPYISNWMFSEDFMPDMGRDRIAYNWNYNRYLDINTVIYWTIVKMQSKIEQRGPYLVDTQNYIVNDHKAVINHRFSDMEINTTNSISIYDSCGDNVIILSIGGEGGLYISTGSLTDSRRSIIVKKSVQKFINDLGLKIPYADKFTLSRGYKNDIQILLFAPSNETISGVPTNWLVLQFTSTLLRYLITTQEFSFFSFE